MAININAEQYGAQFRAFVEFAAQQNNPGHIARIEKPNREAGLIGLEGQPRSITAKSWDGYGQLRGSGSRKVNNEVRTNKAGFERMAIKRFFNELNDESVKEIVLVESMNGKTTKLKRYLTSEGSKSYAEFKKDFRESTGSFVGKEGLYKVAIESGKKCNLRGFKFSDFGMDDDFDSDQKVVVFKSTFLTPQVESVDSSKKKVDNAVSESSIAGITKNPEPNGFTLELRKAQISRQVFQLGFPHILTYQNMRHPLRKNLLPCQVMNLQRQKRLKW